MGRINKHVTFFSIFIFLFVFSSIMFTSFALEPSELTNITVTNEQGEHLTVMYRSDLQGWYVVNEKGELQTYSGMVPNENGLWLCRFGKVDFDFKGLVKFRDEQWYVNGGKVDTAYSDIIIDEVAKYTVENGKVVKTSLSNDGIAVGAISLAVIAGIIFLIIRKIKHRIDNPRPIFTNVHEANQQSSKNNRNSSSSYDKNYYSKKVGVKNLHYKKKDYLTEREEAFYEDLEPIAEKLGYKVSPKMRVADLVDVDGSKYTKDGKTAWYNIIGTHVDFVLIDRSNNKPALLIELDDSTHFTEKTMYTDKVKDHVFQDAGYKLMRVYDSNNLEDKIKSQLNI